MINGVTNIYEDLKWRGLIAQTTDEAELRRALAEGPITFYGGFDPTAQSLHIGHLVLVLTMRRLQLAGHHPIALVGGATGLIGDPRPTTERAMQSPETVANWVEQIKKQLAPLLSFEGDNPTRLVNNLDWINQLSAIQLLRDVGKYFRMSTMLGRDIVARRLASPEGISFAEFSYQLLQAIDFQELNRKYDCVLQVGGNDQWGNMVGGAEFIRKTDQKQVNVLATPLITKSDGTKMGKSEGGAVWLDPELMSPYAFYQFWLNTADADVIHYLKVFTFRTKEEIEQLEKETQASPHLRSAQRALAGDLTKLIHGQVALDATVFAANAIFGRGDLHELDEMTLGGIASELNTVPVEVGSSVIDAAVATKLVASKSAARRAVTEGGLYLNNVKVTDPDAVLSDTDFLAGRFALLRRGKKTLAVASRLTS